MRSINAAKSLGMFVVSVTFGLIATATVLGFLGRWWWCFELAAHFRVQYLVLLLASALVYLVRRKMKPAILSVFFAGLNLWPIAPLYFGPADPPWMRIPIDHCLTSPEIAIHLHRVGPYVGSDHFGIIVDFSVGGPVKAD